MFEIASVRRQARSLDRVEHRPWPVPDGRWQVGMTWSDLLFAHWRVPLEEVRHHVPSELEVELHDGSAWVGIVPFRTAATRPRGALPVPGLSSFLELNVRTYVRTRDEKPGVWFFSLDASSRLAAAAARRAYRLPYFHARIALDRVGNVGGEAADVRRKNRDAEGGAWDDGWYDAECARVGERGKVFSGRYRPAGEVFHAEPGSLEWFLAERYCLYASDPRGRLLRAEIHHDLWPLQPADCEIELTSIAPFELHGPPLCWFAARQDVLAWPLEPVST